MIKVLTVPDFMGVAMDHSHRAGCLITPRMDKTGNTFSILPILAVIFNQLE